MAPDSKIGVLATEDESGMPHLSFISSIQALGTDQLTFGKFSVGYSKRNIEVRPDVAFLVLTAEMEWVRGNAHYTHNINTGELFEAYNSKPLFRYNTYFGFDHVYIMDLVRITEPTKLPMPKIIAGAVRSRISAGRFKQSTEDKLRHFGTELVAKLDSLKFVAWHAADGQLEIMPIIQGGNAGTDRIVFSHIPYGAELKTIPDGAKAAILTLNLDMQSVEAEGTLHRHGGVHVLDIERVYNSMPPKMEYIYPRPDRPQAVTEF
jgi:hypothetical protein